MIYSQNKLLERFNMFRLNLIYILFIIMLCVNLSYSIDIPKPRQGFKTKKLEIKGWNPPSGLSAHVADGSNMKIDPFYNLDINLGYLRVFTKSFEVGNSTVVNNSNFPFIIEFKPFDFISFVNSGSQFSIDVEKKDWLRNFTLIASNRTFSSTQFITSFMLWYGDLLASAVSIKSVSTVSPLGIQAATTTLEVLYFPTRRMGFGFSDRFHLYQSDDFALGLMLYYEMQIPRGREVVLKNYTSLVASSSTRTYLEQYANSNRLTFAALAGLYFRYQEGKLNISGSAVYLRRQGDFDAWYVSQHQNTVAVNYEMNYDDRYIFLARYFMIQNDYSLLADNTLSNIFSIGGEVRGITDEIKWLGLALDLFFLNFEQTRLIFGDYNGRFTGFHILPMINWYPLSFHSKNYALKFSFISSYVFAYQKSSGQLTPLITNNIDQYDEGYSFMLRISYDIAF